MMADGAFQARLAKARSARERALADLGGEEAPLRGRKPWERRAAARPVPPRDGPAPESVLILKEQDRHPGAAPDARVGFLIPAPAHSPNEPGADPQRADGDRHRRRGSLRVAGGFVAGIVIGIAIGAGIASLMPHASAPAPASGAGAPDAQTGTAIAVSDDPAAPAAAGHPAAATRPPVVFAAVPGVVPPPADIPAAPGTPAADSAVSLGPPPGLAPQPARGLDLSLPRQASPVASPPTAFAQTVFLQAPSGVADGAVAAVLGTLDRAGFTIAESRRVGLSISRSNVRYFHAADAAAADRLAGEIGAVARDFTAYRPSPPSGTIEVWLAGRSAGARRPASVPQRAESDEQLLMLRRLIIEKLRASGNAGP